MKIRNMFAFVTLIAAIVFLAVPGMAQVNEHGDKNFTGKVNLDGDFYLKGTLVSATAGQLNSGLATTTSTQISNAVLKVYGSNLVMKAGGATTLSGTLTSTGVASISNEFNIVYGSNITAKILYLLKVNGASMATSVNSVNSGEIYVDATDSNALRLK